MKRHLKNDPKWPLSNGIQGSAHSPLTPIRDWQLLTSSIWLLSIGWVVGSPKSKYQQETSFLKTQFKLIVTKKIRRLFKNRENHNTFGTSQWFEYHGKDFWNPWRGWGGGSKNWSFVNLEDLAIYRNSLFPKEYLLYNLVKPTRQWCTRIFASRLSFTFKLFW